MSSFVDHTINADFIFCYFEYQRQGGEEVLHGRCAARRPRRALAADKLARPSTSGKIKHRLTGVPKKVPQTKKLNICGDPGNADPVCPSPSAPGEVALAAEGLLQRAGQLL